MSFILPTSISTSVQQTPPCKTPGNLRLGRLLRLLRLEQLALLACLALLALLALSASTGALAQAKPPAPAPAPLAAAPARPCPPSAQLKAADLHGQWRATFSGAPRGLPAEARLQLQRHAEFSDSLAGVLQRELGAAPGGKVPGHAARAQVAGDLEVGLLMLDESSNGVNLTASWDGKVVEGSCGNRIEGVWKDLSDAAAPDTADVPFTLTRLSRW